MKSLIPTIGTSLHRGAGHQPAESACFSKVVPVGRSLRPDNGRQRRTPRLRLLVAAGVSQRSSHDDDISNIEIRRCIEADKAEWEAWADEPIEPHLVVRLMAAVYSPKSIPPALQASRRAMEEFASALHPEPSGFCREKGMRACLVLSRRSSTRSLPARVWFDKDGEITGVTEDTFEKSFGPYMQIGGRKFLLNFLEGGPFVKEVEK